MMKKLIIFAAALAIIIFIAVLDYYTPKTLDWTPTFNDNDKKPCGKYIISRVADKLFRNGIKTVDSTFYQLTEENTILIDKNDDTIIKKPQNYIVIAESYKPDHESVIQLLNWVRSGNNAFISASSISPVLHDSLNFTSKQLVHFSITKNDSDNSAKLNFTNSKLKNKKSYFMQKSFNYSIIEKFDTLKTTILGKYNNSEVNFISIRYGKGNFFINTANYMFTNYNVVKPGNIDYACTALSYLPYDNKTLWSTEFSIDTETTSTPLRYILSKPPLKWAYYLSILSLLLFMIFKAKRLQRIIPIIRPLENATLNFTKTIADLYLYRHDNKGIAQKKAKHFLEFVRNKFGLRTHELDNDFREKLTMKTGIESDIINSIISEINRLGSWEKISDEHLQNLNNKIDYFYKRCNANFSLRK